MICRPRILYSGFCLFSVKLFTLVHRPVESECIVPTPAPSPTLFTIELHCREALDRFVVIPQFWVCVGVVDRRLQQETHHHFRSAWKQRSNHGQRSQVLTSTCCRFVPLHPRIPYLPGLHFGHFPSKPVKSKTAWHSVACCLKFCPSWYASPHIVHGREDRFLPLSLCVSVAIRGDTGAVGAVVCASVLNLVSSVRYPPPH
jgi:hypothetical protein